MSPRAKLTLAIIVGFTCASAASAAETVTYTYDSRGRLVKVVRDQPGTVNDAQVCYKYDKADNRSNVKVDVGSAPLCPGTT